VKLLFECRIGWTMSNWPHAYNSVMNDSKSYTQSSIKAAISLDCRQVVVLFIHWPWNYLITGGQSSSRKGKAYDPGEKDNGHNRVELSRLLHGRRPSKSTNIQCGLSYEHILQPIFELHLESGGRYPTIHANNIRPHTVGKSWILYEENSLRITPHSLYSLNLAVLNFVFWMIWSIAW
jgi:hypothetical protein